MRTIVAFKPRVPLGRRGRLHDRGGIEHGRNDENTNSCASVDLLRGRHTGRSQGTRNGLLDSPFLLRRRLRLSAVEHDPRAAFGLDLNVDNHAGVPHCAGGTIIARSVTRLIANAMSSTITNGVLDRGGSRGLRPGLPTRSVRRRRSGLRPNAGTVPVRCSVAQLRFDAVCRSAVAPSPRSRQCRPAATSAPHASMSTTMMPTAPGIEADAGVSARRATTRAVGRRGFVRSCMAGPPVWRPARRPVRSSAPGQHTA